MISFSQVSVDVNISALHQNIDYACKLCRAKGIDLAVVVKSICADKRIMGVVESSNAEVIADSRITNFASLYGRTRKVRQLIRPSSPREAEATVYFSELSMQSSLNTIKMLEIASEKHKRRHGIIIMIDIGDLRDGIYYKDEKTIFEIASYVEKSKSLRLAGIAANYNCFSGLLPNSENMEIMAQLFNKLMPYFNTNRPVLSCGNSSAIKLLTQNTVPIPPEINQFRIGESIFLGKDPSDNTVARGFRTDTFTLQANVVEVYEKPVGFGRTMRRGVLSFGRQDLNTDYISPIDESIKILGACSDECVIDLTNARKQYQVGDVVGFNLEYNALMTLFAGRLANKNYVYGRPPRLIINNRNKE